MASEIRVRNCKDCPFCGPSYDPLKGRLYFDSPSAPSADAPICSAWLGLQVEGIWEKEGSWKDICNHINSLTEVVRVNPEGLPPNGCPLLSISVSVRFFGNEE